MLTQIDTRTGRRRSRYFDGRRNPWSRGRSVPMTGSDTNTNTYDTHLRVDGIHGSSIRAGYRGWHDVDGYQLAVRKSHAGRPIFDALQIQSKLSALPEFTLAVLIGQSIRSVELEIWSKRVRTGPVMVVKLTDVRVCKSSSRAATGKTGQTLGLTFGKIEFHYYAGGRGASKAAIVKGWDLTQNRQV